MYLHLLPRISVLRVNDSKIEAHPVKIARLPTDQMTTSTMILKPCSLYRMVSRILVAVLVSLFAGACHANRVTSSNGTTIGELTKVNRNPSSVQLETSCTESDFYKLTFVTADFAVHFPTPSSLEQAFPWNHTSTDPSQNGWYSKGLERICDANGWRVDKCDGLYRERIAQGYLYLCDPK